MNSVHVIGRLTHDPTVPDVGAGLVLVTFRLAISRAASSEADFVTVKVWGRHAAAIRDHLHRGRRVVVQGRLEHSEWRDANGGREERLAVVADRVGFLDPATSSTAAQTQDVVVRGA